ncbi:MAG: RNA polymerase sigma factor [Turneriella sp.]|nr:RNA polymerase sigma factor [Turneriella sp.]
MRYARSRVYDCEDAEDICSEAWLRFYEGYGKQEKIHTTPEKVLFGILRHLLADYYRKKKQIRTALLVLEERTGMSGAAPSADETLLWAEFEDHLIACLFALKDALKLAWLLKFDPARIEWISVLSGKTSEEIRALHRVSDARDIFIDEAAAANLMRVSVWSFRRKYEKAQRIVNDLMRKNHWGDLLDRN